MVSSYTEKDLNTMINLYTENPGPEVVAKLSVMFNRPRKSIISKLSKEGVYITIGYRSKTGKIPITKLQLVRCIEDILDIELPDLAKAPKPTLQKLVDTLGELEQLTEDALGLLKDQYETKNVLDEIAKVKK